MTDLHPIRALSRQKIYDILNHTKKSKNIEIATFNWTIGQVTEKQNELHLTKSWDCPAFKKLYISKIRSILFNLSHPKNPSFKENILSGTIETKQVPSLKPQEIYPELWEPILQKKLAREKNTLKWEKDILENAVEGQYTCRKCKCKKISYFELQTRSADEPMTIYFTCINCEFKWKE